MSINYYYLGRNIRDSRVRLGISQAKLAEIADLSITHMSNIESGTKQVSLEALYRIAQALNVTVSQLIGDDSDCLETLMIWNAYKLFRHCSLFEKKMIFDVMCTVKKNFQLQKTGGIVYPGL